jgi:hypothetical protein
LKILSKNKLVMQVLVGEIEDEQDKDELDGVDKICVGMSQAPIINFTDGTKVIFSWEELCKMAIDFKKKEEEKAKKALTPTKARGLKTYKDLPLL